MFQRGWKAKVMERSANFSDEVTEGRSSARVEEERIEREGWSINAIMEYASYPSLEFYCR